MHDFKQCAVGAITKNAATKKAGVLKIRTVLNGDVCSVVCVEVMTQLLRQLQLKTFACQ